MTPVEQPIERHFSDTFPLPSQPAPVRVDFDRFLELMIGRRRLTRADSPDKGLYGLIDHEDGCWYVVNDREFDHWHNVPR